MADEVQPFSSRYGGDPDANSGDSMHSSDPAATPGWWKIIWTLWGVLICLLVWIFDGTPLVASCWLTLGVAIGLLGWPSLMSWFLAVQPWFEELLPADIEIQRQIFELIRQEPNDVKSIEDMAVVQAFGGILAVPAFLGLVHGTLLGGVGGALASFDPTWQSTVSNGTVIGIGIGIAGMSLMAALVMSIYMPSQKVLPRRSRITRRLLMIVSPLLAVIASCYYLANLFKWRTSQRTHR